MLQEGEVARQREGGWLEVGLEKSKWVQLKLEVCRSYADKNGQARLDNV